MANEKGQLTITVNQFLTIIGILLTIVLSLFVAAGWVVNRLDLFEESLNSKIDSVEAQVDELAEDVAFMRGQLDKKK